LASIYVYIYQPGLIATLSFKKLISHCNIGGRIYKGGIKVEHYFMATDRLQAALIDYHPRFIVATAHHIGHLKNDTFLRINYQLE